MLGSHKLLTHNYRYIFLTCLLKVFLDFNNLLCIYKSITSNLVKQWQSLFLRFMKSILNLVTLTWLKNKRDKKDIANTTKSYKTKLSSTISAYYWKLILDNPEALQKIWQ